MWFMLMMVCIPPPPIAGKIQMRNVVSVTAIDEQKEEWQPLAFVIELMWTRYEVCAPTVELRNNWIARLGYVSCLWFGEAFFLRGLEDIFGFLYSVCGFSGGGGRVTLRLLRRAGFPVVVQLHPHLIDSVYGVYREEMVLLIPTSLALPSPNRHCFWLAQA